MADARGSTAAAGGGSDRGAKFKAGQAIGKPVARKIKTAKTSENLRKLGAFCCPQRQKGGRTEKASDVHYRCAKREALVVMENPDNNAATDGRSRRPRHRPAAPNTHSDPELEKREIELYDYLAKPKDLRGFLRATSHLLAPLGFTNFGLLLARTAEDVQKLWMYPEQSREYYLEAGLHRGDFNVKHCLVSSTPVFQSQINEYVDTSPVENELLAMNREISRNLEEQGFLDYCAFGFDSPCGNSRAIFSFSRKGAPLAYIRQQAGAHMEDLRRLAQAVEHVGSRRHGMDFLRNRGQGIISNAPLRLLDVLANDNVNLAQAAEMLHISEGTANTHVRTIKGALGVPTIARAVSVALQRGLIISRASRL